MNKFLATVAVLAALAAPAAALASVSLTLQGGGVTVEAGRGYQEPGYTALSSVDGNITNLVSVSSPGTSLVGHFSIGYSVTDSTLTSASASRELTVTGGGGTMPWCSGPMAPGWRVDLPNGGCGGDSHVQYFAPLECPFWYPAQMCLARP